jgi:hypothetical protein
LNEVGNFPDSPITRPTHCVRQNLLPVLVISCRKPTSIATDAETGIGLVLEVNPRTAIEFSNFNANMQQMLTTGKFNMNSVISALDFFWRVTQW